MKHVKSVLLAIVVLLGGTAWAETLDFNGCAVTAYGATISSVNGEKVLAFVQSGTLSVSADVRADILVVGGGGSGAAGRKGQRNWYGGAGGNGGNGTVGSYEMPQGTYAVTVGAGGAAVVNSSSSTSTKSGSAGGTSSIELTSGGGSFAKLSGSGGSGGASTAYKNKDSASGMAGTCPETAIAGGTAKKYGNGGAGCTKGEYVEGADGAKGTGDGGGGGANGASSGAGGSGVVIVRLKEVLAARVPIERPTAASGLVYNGTIQTGVAAGGHYTLSGTYTAKDAGSYEATVTPANGYCWTDKTYGAFKLAWSIARRPVTVSVVSTNKVVGAEEPVYLTKAEGFVAGDDAEASWKVWRTNLVEQADGSRILGEDVGVYDLVLSGTGQTTNYAITYVNGVKAFEIRPTGPSIAGGMGSVSYDPESHEVVVMPDKDVSSVELVDMPDDATALVPVSVDTIKGVTSNQVVVVAEATNGTGTVKVDITEAFRIAETPAGVTIELNEDPAAAVEIEIAGTKETVKVKPELTDSGDAVVEPLTVADKDVELGVKTIPGLTYRLNRSSTLGAASATVASETAKGTRTKLTDRMSGEKPSQAFYVIEVTK